jgi:hypothetical protein
VSGGCSRFQLVEECAGSPWRNVSGQQAIEQKRLTAAHGARGIVCETDGVNAHGWDVVVRDGQVY